MAYNYILFITLIKIKAQVWLIDQLNHWTHKLNPWSSKFKFGFQKKLIIASLLVFYCCINKLYKLSSLKLYPFFNSLGQKSRAGLTGFSLQGFTRSKLRWWPGLWLHVELGVSCIYRTKVPLSLLAISFSQHLETSAFHAVWTHLSLKPAIVSLVLNFSHASNFVLNFKTLI